MSFNLNKLVQPECGAPNPLVAAAQQIASHGRSMGATPMTSLARLHAQQHQNLSRPAMNFSKEFAQQVNHFTMTNSSHQMPGPSHVHHQQQPHRQNQFSDTQQYQNQPLNVGGSTVAMAQQQSIHPMSYFKPEYNNYIQQHRQPALSRVEAAADQLENKYRNDIIAQTSGISMSHHGNETRQQEASSTKATMSKLDDVEFWQGLAQTYVGPATLDSGLAGMTTKRKTGLARAEGEETSTTKDEDIQEWVKDLKLGAEKETIDYAFDEKNPFFDQQIEDPFAEGLKRLEMGDIPSAALLFEAAVKREPANTLAWQYLGTTQAQNEKDRSAITALMKCLELEPTNQQAKLAIAASLVNETRYHEACDHLIEWLAKHERYGASQLGSNWLDAYEKLNNTDYRNSSEFSYGLSDQHYEFVRDSFVQAARMSPNDPDPEVQNSLGVIFNMRGDYEKAVDCFRAALSVRSDDSLLWNRLGATLANWSKSDEAVIAYRRALEISPGFLRSRYNLAISLIHLNLYDEAARQLMQILNTQAAGEGSKSDAANNLPKFARIGSITSTPIWNTLRTVATLMNRPELYPMIDERRLELCNERLFRGEEAASRS